MDDTIEVNWTNANGKMADGDRKSKKQKSTNFIELPTTGSSPSEQEQRNLELQLPQDVGQENGPAEAGRERKEKLPIKAVKLSDYLRGKGHEVPKSLLEQEEKDSNYKAKGKKEESENVKAKKNKQPVFLERKAKKEDNAEEEFPLSKMIEPPEKKREKKLVLKNDSATGFLPRNLKLKSAPDLETKALTEGGENESGGVSQEVMDRVETTARRLNQALKVPAKKKEPSPPVPSRKRLVDISDSDDEFVPAPPVVKKENKEKKKIVFGSLKRDHHPRITIQPQEPSQQHHRSHQTSAKRHISTGEEGEIPSSDEGAASSDDDEEQLMDLLVGESDGELQESDNEKNQPDAEPEKKRKKKKIKKEKKRRRRSRSRSSEDRLVRKKSSRRSVSPYQSRRGHRRSPSPSRYRGRDRDRDYWKAASYRRGPVRGPDASKGKWAWSRGTAERRRVRSRSPSARYRKQSPSPEIEIDKKKLFEIARKNASAMLQAGTLQQIKNMSADEIAILRSGGKSVDELVDYCKKLQKKAEKAEKKEQGLSSSDEGEKSEEGESFINHPFVLNQSKIVMNIPNAVPLPARTPAQRAQEEAALRLCFPVSSGQQHRENESDWTLVVPQMPGVEAAKTMKALPAPPQPPKIGGLSGDPTDPALPPPPAPPGGAAPPPPTAAQMSNLAKALTGPETETRKKESVFDDPPSPPAVGIGDIVSKRLSAVKRLQDNPNDVEAMKLMHCAEEEMKKWAASKNLPGQFTGSTGVQCLTPNELGPAGPQAWARRDQLRNTKVLNSGVGMHLLQKMGWRPGEGLGKFRAGPVEPLTLDIKSDRRGLVSLDEMPASKNKPNVSFAKDMAGKHPVSALHELCNKRRWSPPSYTCVESGISYNRRYLWKVVVNNVEYQPATPSANKKEAKAQAAQVVLQSLGLIPRDSKLPVVIETSAAAAPYLTEIRNSILELLHKKTEAVGGWGFRFNIGHFSRETSLWDDQAVVCTLESASKASEWIRSWPVTDFHITPRGHNRSQHSGPHVLTALMQAFSDCSVEAVYMIASSAPYEATNDIVTHVSGDHKNNIFQSVSELPMPQPLVASKSVPVKMEHVVQKYSMPHDPGWGNEESLEKLKERLAMNYEREALSERQMNEIRKMFAKGSSIDSTLTVFKLCHRIYGALTTITKLYFEKQKKDAKKAAVKALKTKKYKFRSSRSAGGQRSSETESSQSTTSSGSDVDSTFHSDMDALSVRRSRHLRTNSKLSNDRPRSSLSARSLTSNSSVKNRGQNFKPDWKPVNRPTINSGFVSQPTQKTDRSSAWMNSWMNERMKKQEASLLRSRTKAVQTSTGDGLWRPQVNNKIHSTNYSHNITNHDNNTTMTSQSADNDVQIETIRELVKQNDNLVRALQRSSNYKEEQKKTEKNRNAVLSRIREAQSQSHPHKLGMAGQKQQVVNEIQQLAKTRRDIDHLYPQRLNSNGKLRDRYENLRQNRDEQIRNTLERRQNLKTEQQQRCYKAMYDKLLGDVTARDPNNKKIVTAAQPLGL